jgi:mono/diheme cytochrome c family protein
VIPRNLVLLLALTGAACGRGAAVGTSATAAPAASDLYSQRCAPCHGAAGLGNGPAAAGLDPKPRSFVDRAWQASVTDEHIRDTIAKGGSAVGKSALMPPQPDLAGTPALQALVQIVRGFAAK